MIMRNDEFDKYLDDRRLSGVAHALNSQTGADVISYTWIVPGSHVPL